MPVKGIDFFPEEDLEVEGELLPLIEILESRQKHKPREDEQISPKEWEDIDE